jgi:cell division protein FtsQ
MSYDLGSAQSRSRQQAKALDAKRFAYQPIAGAKRRVSPGARTAWSGESRKDGPGFSRGDGRPRGDGDRGSAKKGGSGRRSPALAVIWCFAICALAACIAFAAASPSFKVTKIQLSSNLEPWRATLLPAIGIREDQYFFATDERLLTSALESIPAIAEARVEKRFPDTLIVDAILRVPVAAILVASEGRTRVAYVDGSGILFEGVEPRGTVPVISGLSSGNYAPGARMPQALLPMLQGLADVAASEPDLLAAISEIRVERRKSGDELVLFPFDYRTPVRTGTVLNAETLRSIILVLDVVRGEGLEGGGRELDFRSRTIAFRAKGG